MGSESRDIRLWAGRILTGGVLFMNVQAALLFLWRPEAYSPGFELSGPVGDQIVRGIGLLFLMWNVPYAFAFASPVKYRVSLYEALIMQAIGVVGETLLLLSLPGSHPALQATIGRFIVFDAAGLAALLLATWVTRKL